MRTPANVVIRGGFASFYKAICLPKGTVSQKDRHLVTLLGIVVNRGGNLYLHRITVDDHREVTVAHTPSAGAGGPALVQND